MYHVNIVWDVVDVIQEDLVGNVSDDAPNKTPTSCGNIPFNTQVINSITTSNINQQKMMQQMKTMMHNMQVQISNGGESCVAV